MYIYKRTKKYVASKNSDLSGLRQVSLIWFEMFKLLFYFLWHRQVNPLVYASKKNNKKCMFTVLIGDYDDLNSPKVVTPGWDYICLTNNPKLTSDIWQVVFVTDKDLDPIRLSRKYKICNHLVDSKYDISIYIDANICIKGNLDHFLNISWCESSNIAILYHPYHTDASEELNACLSRSLDNRDTIIRQKKDYKKMGFRDAFPQVNNRLIIRRPNHKSVKNLMINWFDQLLKYSYRDQLSFNYVLENQTDIQINYIEYWKFSAYFLKKDHK